MVAVTNKKDIHFFIYEVHRPSEFRYMKLDPSKIASHAGVIS